jgi:hypothetical protein
MKITGFSEYLFWSYDKSADLPEEVIIKQIVQYGEIKDMLNLMEKIDSKKIEKVIGAMKMNRQNKKRINFFLKVIF